MNYYLNSNKQPSGDYEVHQSTGCSHPASSENQISLGSFDNCHQAVAEAKKLYPNHKSSINGCYYCCNPCHTS